MTTPPLRSLRPAAGPANSSCKKPFQQWPLEGRPPPSRARLDLYQTACLTNPRPAPLPAERASPPTTCLRRSRRKLAPDRTPVFLAAAGFSAPPPNGNHYGKPQPAGARWPRLGRGYSAPRCRPLLTPGPPGKPALPPPSPARIRRPKGRRNCKRLEPLLKSLHLRPPCSPPKRRHPNLLIFSLPHARPPLLQGPKRVLRPWQWALTFGPLPAQRPALPEPIPPLKKVSRFSS